MLIFKLNSHINKFLAQHKKSIIWVHSSQQSEEQINIIHEQIHQIILQHSTNWRLPRHFFKGSDEQVLVFIDTMQHKVIGFVALTYYSSKACEISLICLHKLFIGKGMGSALIIAAIETAQLNNACKIDLTPSAGNLSTVEQVYLYNFYHQIGFEIERLNGHSIFNSEMYLTQKLSFWPVKNALRVPTQSVEVIVKTINPHNTTGAYSKLYGVGHREVVSKSPRQYSIQGIDVNGQEKPYLIEEIDDLLNADACKNKYQPGAHLRLFGLRNHNEVVHAVSESTYHFYVANRFKKELSAWLNGARKTLSKKDNSASLETVPNRLKN